MEYRRLGSTGMYVSEISYGNWITHGSQVESEAAIKCVREALSQGITTFDTADVYANTKAEVVLAKALKGVRRESYELFTKVYWPTGPGKNDRGLSRKHIMESCHASLKRLKTDHIDLYQLHRFDFETPLEESLSALDDLVRQGKVMYVGFSEWTAEQIARGLKINAATTDLSPVNRSTRRSGESLKPKLFHSLSAKESDRLSGLLWHKES
jgi:aryl-alcohol dehydrogenase-like predicted oxidoreductase